MLAGNIVYLHGGRTAPTPLGHRISAALARLSTFVLLAAHNYATRRSLIELDDRSLADLGISRAQARFEAARPIWDSRDR